jgi:hypothetical protein
MESFAEISLTWFWLPIPLLGLFAWYCLFLYYPNYLNERIKKGKFWIYIPSWYKGSRKRMVQTLTPIIEVIIAISFFLPVYLFTKNPVISLSSIALFFVLVKIFGNRVCRHRYIQQRDAYFREYDLLVRQFAREGKKYKETELNNRCMYQHQATLKNADEKGRLIKYLNLKANSKKLPPIEDVE